MLEYGEGWFHLFGIDVYWVLRKQFILAIEQIRDEL